MPKRQPPPSERRPGRQSCSTRKLRPYEPPARAGGLRVAADLGFSARRVGSRTSRPVVWHGGRLGLRARGKQAARALQPGPPSFPVDRHRPAYGRVRGIGSPAITRSRAPRGTRSSARSGSPCRRPAWAPSGTPDRCAPAAPGECFFEFIRKDSVLASHARASSTSVAGSGTAVIVTKLLERENARLRLPAVLTSGLSLGVSRCQSCECGSTSLTMSVKSFACLLCRRVGSPQAFIFPASVSSGDATRTRIPWTSAGTARLGKSR